MEERHSGFDLDSLPLRFAPKALDFCLMLYGDLGLTRPLCSLFLGSDTSVLCNALFFKSSMSGLKDLKDQWV